MQKLSRMNKMYPLLIAFFCFSHNVFSQCIPATVQSTSTINTPNSSSVDQLSSANFQDPAASAFKFMEKEWTLRRLNENNPSSEQSKSSNANKVSSSMMYKMYRNLRFH